jgi:hypothetical protein
MAEMKLKNKLYEKLELVEDESIIENILLLLEMESHESIIKFDDEQLRQIDNAKLSARSKGIPNDEVFNRNKEWLSK